MDSQSMGVIAGTHIFTQVAQQNAILDKYCAYTYKDETFYRRDL